MTFSLMYLAGYSKPTVIPFISNAVLSTLCWKMFQISPSYNH